MTNTLPWRTDGLDISEYFYVQFILHDCSHHTMTLGAAYTDTTFHQPCPGKTCWDPHRPQGSGWPGQKACMNSLLDLLYTPKHYPVLIKFRLGEKKSLSQLQQQWLDSDPTHHSRHYHILLQGKTNLRMDFTQTHSMQQASNRKEWFSQSRNSGRRKTSTTPLGSVDSRRHAARPNLILVRLGLFLH